MAERTPEPTELIYVPGNSWAPVTIALGLAIAVAGIFILSYFAWIGLFVALLGARAWWKQDEDEIAHMRREQRSDTAVIPAEPIRRD